MIDVKIQNNAYYLREDLKIIFEIASIIPMNICMMIAIDLRINDPLQRLEVKVFKYFIK